MKQLIIFLGLSNFMFGQEDSSFLKNIQYVPEVSVNIKSQTVFEAPGIYLIDFYVDQDGKFLLLKSKNNYMISKLANDLTMESTFLLTFKPLSLIRDCLGKLQVLSEDSIYRVDETSIEIGVYEPNPISFYFDYLANCEGETKNQLIYKSLSNSNQTVNFIGVDKEDHVPLQFYKTEDTIQILVAKDWQQQIFADSYDFEYQMQEINIMQLYGNRDNFDRVMFFSQVIAKTDYNPLFTVGNEVFIFDHYSNSLVLFDGKSLKKLETKPIIYHKIKGWNKQLLYDQVTQIFYTTYLLDGNFYIAELSNSNFSILKSVKVQKNAHPKKMMIYGGFLYYDFKSSMEDSFNELYQQRL